MDVLSKDKNERLFLLLLQKIMLEIMSVLLGIHMEILADLELLRYP